MLGVRTLGLSFKVVPNSQAKLRFFQIFAIGTSFCKAGHI